MINTVIFSGGMDSYTLLHQVVRANPQEMVHALTFDYGQRHIKEIEYAKRAVDAINMDGKLHSVVRHVIVEMAGIGGLLAGSSQTSRDVPVPHGHYAADNMKTTVVPGRNTIMLSLAMGYTESECMRHSIESYGAVYYGAHAGDHTIYPDCRPEYFLAMNRTMDEASDGKISLRAPYLHKKKGDILRTGLAMGLDYSQTWTCYEGGEHPCGKCGACQERAEAFHQNNVVDPLILAAT